MSQRNDTQLLLQLTSDVIAHRTHLFGGQGINKKYCPILNKSPLVRKLITTGVAVRKRESEHTWRGGNYCITTLVHQSPRETKAVCPACKQQIMHVPEVSMTGHLTTCRFQNIYGKVIIKPAIKRLVKKLLKCGK